MRGPSNDVFVLWNAFANDVRAGQVQALARTLGFDAGAVCSGRAYVVDADIEAGALLRAARATLGSSTLETVGVGAPLFASFEPACHLVIGRQSGVTDDEGRTAQTELFAGGLMQVGGPGAEQSVFAHQVYLFEQNLQHEQLLRLGGALANPIVDTLQLGAGAPNKLSAPRVLLPKLRATEVVSLDLSDAELNRISADRCLHLSVAELRAIREYYLAQGGARQQLGLPAQPLACELEIFAQTWSEHCKHKEFSAHIEMTHNGRDYAIDSLFKSTIRKATDEIRVKYGQEDWMVTVFSDNAGLVKLDDKRLFALKVETHNSPSALDPVGGAMTGVLGTNRDAFGTGKGGAQLLFNTNVLCMGPQDYAAKLLPGQTHPARIYAGVATGIAEAGNTCGVPTINGAVIFDNRFAGKPLVYCGTGAILSASYPNGPAWQKDLQAGDRIVSVGGGVGQDGIHGATFSSVELRDGMSRAVVQIGSPLTQKRVSDFMEEACALGLVAASTDNGAGGLSSSVGELAQLSNGASVQLERVALKYEGLAPWEILLSESQERMTLAVRPGALHALLELAEQRSVEARDIGEFNDSGYLDVRYHDKREAYLDLNFLHNGVPRKRLRAQWTDLAALSPTSAEASTERQRELAKGPAAWGDSLLKLLASENIRSRESLIRQFDHEVKGKTIVKSLMGERGIAPQDAAVMRLDFSDYLGVAVASGICPKFGDLDPYEMSAGAFDEALRSLVSVGARLPRVGEAPCWSACDNFCVPDSVFDAQTNADGAEKLGKLVRMCEALYDMSTYFDVPMTSGKDSMKNDFRSQGTKISVPPTVLYTFTARIADVRDCTTSEFKVAGDRIYLMGETRSELGASEYAWVCEPIAGAVPRVRKERFREVYEARNRCQPWTQSSHDCSDGGLAVCIAECCIGANLGAAIDVSATGTNLSVAAALFAESHGRLLVSVAEADSSKFEELAGAQAVFLGYVTSTPRLVVEQRGVALIDLPLATMTRAFCGSHS